MSEPARPSIALVFGSVLPPQGDIVELFLHLGCTKEVNSFEVKLQNWNKKYSPGGTYPILVGLDGSISLGRGATCPLIMTCHVENVTCKSTPEEHYITVSGRCWGERLFRYTVTKAYLSQKGEDIVKNIIDYYAGLSHVRGSTELIENTDTTYINLTYDESPAWDILKYIAQSADKSGVIGFDFRVAPDGKFEFFLVLSKTNSTTLVEQIDDSITFRKDITRIRNRVRIYGVADKSIPINKVEWTRSLTPSDGVWTGSSGVVSVDSTGAPDGGACIKLSVPGAAYYGAVVFTLNPSSAINTEIYPLLNIQFKLDDTYSGPGVLTLWDANSKAASKNISISPDEAWHTFEIGVGSAYANQWESIQAGFDWTQIRVVKLTFWFPETVGAGDFRIHALYFGGRRYSSTQEDAASQAAYGIREYAETDEELWTDSECERRAKAILNYLKSPAEYLTLVSTVIDYGSTPILAGDKVHVHLPNENVDSDFRVESVEYRVLNECQVLETTLELGKEPPQLADYLYGLRTFTVNVEKLSRTKVGKRGVPVSTGGGGGSGGSYFNSNVEIDKTTPVLNFLTSRVLKAALGFDGVNFFVGSYLGDLVLRAFSTVIRPYADGSDNLGSSSFRFNSLYLKTDFWTAGVQVVGSDGRVTLVAFPRDTAGLIIEAQGAGFYPMYVNPNGRYVPAAHTHESLVSSTRHVEMDPTNAVLNFYDGVNMKGAIGHDGANFFVVAYNGNLILYSATGLIQPNTDGGADLGSSSYAKRFGTIHLKNGVVVAGVQTVDSDGRVTMSAMPRDTAGLVLEAQGSGFYPMYVNPNGRYTPPTHTHASLYPSGGAGTGQVGDTTTYWNVVGTNSLWYKAIGSFACSLEKRNKEVTRLIQSRSQAEEILTHETTKTWRHMPYAISKKNKGKIICTCGNAVKEPCPEHRKKWEDIYIVNTGAQLEAAAFLVLELSADVRRLETELADMRELMKQNLEEDKS